MVKKAENQKEWREMADLKNIRQIGSPTDTDKIYMEDNAYRRIHREEFSERRVFVLMGHTECAPGGYSSFVEAVIPVRDISFSGGVPIWNNHAWNSVFGEIKRSFEHSVIVGWALDTKGMPPRMTAELEAVHKEQFGGAHQLLYLLDTLEQEECFYQNRSGYLCPKDGFYIYFDPESRAAVAESAWKAPQEERGKVWKAEKLEDTVTDREAYERLLELSKTDMPRGRYRELMYGEQKEQPKDSGKWVGSVAVIAAVLLLFAIIGTGIRQGRFSLEGIGQTMETIQTNVLPQSGETGTEAASTEAEDVSAILRDMEQAQEDAGIVVEEVQPFTD
jgi:hypothetical protein